MPEGVHDSIWRSCEAAAERLRKQRQRDYLESIDEDYPPGVGAQPPEPVEPNLEDLTDDAVDVAVALGVKRAVAERLVVEAWKANGSGSVEDWAAWICRHQNKR